MFKEADHPRAKDGKFATSADHGFTTNKKQNIEQAKKLVEKEGFSASSENPSGRKVNSAFAALASNGKVFINPSSLYWKDPVTAQRQAFESGQLSSADPMHVIHHEIGHLKYDAPDNFHQNSQRDIIGEQVSKYARANPKEFVSEVYAATKAGRTFSDEINRLFTVYAKERPMTRKTELPEHLKRFELKNASQHAKEFYVRHMTPGVVGYEGRKIYVPLDTIKKMASTFTGKPVFIDHQDVALENIEDQADGIITGSFINPHDGWLWSKMLMTSDEGIAAAEDGRMSVSNAHQPSEWGEGGSYLNISYDKSVKGSAFTHLAIVPNPRYEGAMIKTPAQYKAYAADLDKLDKELHNSKKTGDKRMFKFFKTEQKEVNEIDGDSMLTLENGKTVSVAEMVAAVELKNKMDRETDEAKKAAELANGKEVEVDGVKMPVADLVAKFKELQNAAETEATAKAEREATEKAVAETKAKADAEEGKKNFDNLNNARDTSPADVQIISTMQDQVNLGRERY